MLPIQHLLYVSLAYRAAISNGSAIFGLCNFRVKLFTKKPKALLKSPFNFHANEIS